MVIEWGVWPSLEGDRAHTGYVLHLPSIAPSYDKHNADHTGIPFIGSHQAKFIAMIAKPLSILTSGAKA